MLTTAAVYAAALFCSVAAPAAEFFRYDFTASGYGIQSTCYSQPYTETSVAQMQFTFISPAASGGFGPINTVFAMGPYGPGSALIYSNPTKIIMFDGAHEPGSTAFAEVCVAEPFSLTPLTAFAEGSCGQINYKNVSVPNVSIEFYGRITSMSFTQFSDIAWRPAGLVAATPIPEAPTWALMLAGFGLMACALRRRPRLAFA